VNISFIPQVIRASRNRELSGPDSPCHPAVRDCPYWNCIHWTYPHWSEVQEVTSITAKGVGW